MVYNKKNRKTMKLKLEGSLVLLFGFMLILFFVVSCLGEKDVNKEIKKNKNSENSTENDTSTVKLTDNIKLTDNSDDSSFDGSDDLSNSQVEENLSQDVSIIDESKSNNEEIKILREAINEGKYKKIIELTTDKNDYFSKYYRGIAYMSMLLQKKKYAYKLRMEYRNNAEELLREVAYESDQDDDLRARGLLWYGVLLDLAYVDLKNKKKAIAAFYKIENTPVLKDSVYYNDALFYAAQTYSRMGWYGVARNYFKKSAIASRNDITIYDYVDNRFYPVDLAGVVGQQRLQSYVRGYNEAYK